MLTLRQPDAGAVYRLDPELPRDAQKIEVWAQSGPGLLLHQVTLRVDGQPIARLGAPPYKVLWPLEPGKHTFSALGVAAGGQQVESDLVWIEVQE
jgi:hypothetical protein